MKTITEGANERILLQIANKLLQAQRELDELVVQLSLGETEAKDKFEEIKGDFAARVQEFKNSTVGQRLEIVRGDIGKWVDDLEEKLRQGAIDSKEAFEGQEEQIEHTLTELKRNVSNRLSNAVNFDNFYHDIEKFRLKLEILRLAFSLKRLEAKDSFRQSMSDIRKRIDRLITHAKEKVRTRNSKLSEFRKETRQVYLHLKKAIEAL